MSDDIKLIDLEGGEILYNDLRERIENKKGIPKGGQIGQILTKSSNKDYAAVWRTPNIITDVIVDGESVIDDNKAYINTALDHFPSGNNLRVDINNNNFNYASYATAEGVDTTASYRAAHAEGVEATASYEAAHAEGVHTTASNYAAHAEGSNTIASGSYSHAEGLQTQARAIASHAEGSSTSAIVQAAHAEGNSTKAAAIAAHSEGYQTQALGEYSHSEGYSTIASEQTSHAEGLQSTASGRGSHAEGSQNTAFGYASHAEGHSTSANGYSSHTEGRATTAYGDYSHAQGYGTVIHGSYASVFGTYNIPDTCNYPEWVSGQRYYVGNRIKITYQDDTPTAYYVCKVANSDTNFDSNHWQTITAYDYIEVVGNGIDNQTRSNARTLDWQGNEWVAGKVSAGTIAAPAIITEANDLTTKSYVDTTISSAIGNVNQFDIEIVQKLPTTNIKNHTIYFVPKTSGNINDVYNEYIRINNAWEMVGDTQLNLSDYVLKTDYATAGTAGVVKVHSSYGFSMDQGFLKINCAQIENIKAGTDISLPITSYNAHEVAFYGLAKAAGSDEKDSALPLGTYSIAAKSAIRSMIGAAASGDIPSVPVQDVQTNGISILSNGIANIPLGSNSTLGVFKYGNGLARTNDGTLVTWKADNAAIKLGTNQYDVIVPYNQYAAVFYGLAKAAGDSTQSSSNNAVGTYTAEAKTAIQTMLGVPSTSSIPTKVSDLTNDSGYYIKPSGGIPATDLAETYIKPTNYATGSSGGTVKVPPDASGGIGIWSTGMIYNKKATDDQIKEGTNNYYSIVPSNEHQAVFYGLAKAAGDTTQAASENAVGTYTAEAKAAIQNMLGVPSTSDIPDTSIYATKADTVLESSLSRGRKAGTTVGVGSFAFGEDVEASGNYSFAIGLNTQVVGPYGHAEGVYTYAVSGAHAEGIRTKAGISGAHAEGYMTYARGSYASHSEGYMTNALGLTSHSEGLYTLATADTAHSEGYGTAAIGHFSHSSGEGYIGYLSISGPENTVNYTYSYAASDPEFVITKGSLIFIAQSNKWTYISDIDSVNKIITVTKTLGAALENQSVRLIDNIAYGNASSVSGLHNVANGYYQQVTGIFSSSESQYSIWTPNTQYYIGNCVSSPVGVGYQCIVDNNDAQFDEAHWKRIIYNTEHIYIIGNGTGTNARSNAYALTWTGDGHYAGDVYIHSSADSTGGTKVLCEADFATAQDIQTIINGGASA